MPIRKVPTQTPLTDERGNLNRTWVHFLQNTAEASATATSGTGSVAAAPVQPAAADWSIVVVDYGRDDVTGEPKVHLRVTVTSNTAGVAFYSAFQVAAVSPPVDPAGYISVLNQAQSAAGSTILEWYTDRPLVDTVYQFVVTASTGDFQSFPNNVTTSAAKQLTLTAIAYPAQVTGFSVTVIYESPGGLPTGRLVYTLTPPADLEYFSTNIYRILTDNTYTPLGGEVYHLVANTVSGYTQTNLEAWPLGTESYWVFKAQSVSRALLENTAGAPTSNLHVPASTGVVSGASAPTQPGTSDWSISILQYAHNPETGENIAQIQAVITLNSADIRYFSILSYQGASAPGDVNLYQDIGVNQAQATTGATTIVFNVVRAATSLPYRFICIASSPTYTATPVNAGASKALTVLAIAYPAQVTGFSVSATQGNDGGVITGKLTYTFTAPAGDLEYFSTNIYRQETDSGFSPLGSPRGDWSLVANAVGTTQQRDKWVWIAGASYWKFKAQSVSRALLENTNSPPTFNLALGSNPGVDLTNSDFTKISGEMGILGGKYSLLQMGVNKLLAGTATFTGDVSFVRSGGGQVVINSTGVSIKNASGFGMVLDSSGGFAFTDNTNWTISITAHNITGAYLMNSTRVEASGSGGYVMAKNGADIRVDTLVVIDSFGVYKGNGAAMKGACGATAFNLTDGSGNFVAATINSSNVFIGAGANCNAGIAATGFNIYGAGLFGQNFNLFNSPAYGLGFVAVVPAGAFGTGIPPAQVLLSVIFGQGGANPTYSRMRFDGGVLTALA